MPKIKVKGQTVQAGEVGQTRRHTNGQMDGRTLPSTLSPCFAKTTRSIKIKAVGQKVQTGELGNSETQTHGWTDRRTDGCYQVHYLPRFAVDKNSERIVEFNCILLEYLLTWISLHISNELIKS